MSVDSYNKKAPSINLSLKDRLIIGDLTEDIFYRIDEINNPEFLIGKTPPKIGERIMLCYDFQPDSGGYSGWENLTLFIGREDNNGNIHNYVRYFNNISELESVIDNVKFSLDKEYATNRIIEHLKAINKLNRDYELDKD